LSPYFNNCNAIKIKGSLLYEKGFYVDLCGVTEAFTSIDIVYHVHEIDYIRIATSSSFR